jgi:hypothetical protein
MRRSTSLAIAAAVTAVAFPAGASAARDKTGDVHPSHSGTTTSYATQPTSPLRALKVFESNEGVQPKQSKPRTSNR